MTPGEALTGADQGEIEFTADWGQGRSIFGGLQAAALLVRMTAVLGDPSRPARSLTVQFAGPARPGPAAIAARVVRSGGSVSTLAGELIQDGQVVALALGTFATPRASSIRLSAAEPPDPGPLQDVAIPLGIRPVFTQWFDYRFGYGGLPFSGGRDAVVGGLVRPASATPLDASLVVMLADSFPLPALVLAERPVPASSLDLTVHFLADLPRPAGEWIAARVETDAAADGYCDVQGALWAPDGTLVARVRQLGAIYT